MANFRSSTQADLSQPGYFFDVTPTDVISSSTSEIALRSPDGAIQFYKGYFSYFSNGALNWYGSYLTSLTEFDHNGNELWSAYNLTVSGSTYQSYAYSNNFTGLKVYAYNGNDYITGSNLNDYLLGFSGNDSIYSNSGNDRLSGGEGYDYLNGGDGIDTAMYSGLLSQYTISLVNNSVYDSIANRDGQDSLGEIERLSFIDATIGLDTLAFETSGSAYRLYKAAFDRAPDTVGLGYWINYMDHGADIVQNVAYNFILSDEFQSNYGPQLSNNEFITLIYNHVLDRDPDAGGLAYWNDQMDNHGMARSNLLVNFSESAENMSNTADLIVNGVKFDIYTG